MNPAPSPSSGTAHGECVGSARTSAWDTSSGDSPFVTLVNNIQYDTQSAVLGWQSRFRWIVTPGNDVYVVYTHNWLDDPLLSRFSTLDKRFASKILYTYRF